MVGMLLSTQSVIGIILDVVVVAVVLILTIIGFSKGFLRSLINLFSNTILIIISIFTAKYLASLLEKLFGFITFFATQMAKVIGGLAEGVFTTVLDGTESVTSLKAIVNGTDIFGLLKTYMNKVIEGSSIVAGDSIATIVGNSLGAIVSAIISGIIIFLLLKFVLFLLGKIFANITASSKTIGWLDKLLGVIFGACRGVLNVMVFSAVTILMTLIPTVNNFVTPVVQDNTKITKYVYNFTDDLVDKYIISNIDDWVHSLWENREL